MRLQARHGLKNPLKRDTPTKKAHCDAVNLAAAVNSTTPTTTTSSSSTPAPTPTPKPKPAQQAAPPAPKPKPASNSNSGGGGDSGTGSVCNGGDVTFYAPGLNACGTVDPPDAYIAAMAHAKWDGWPGFDGNSNQHPMCHKPIRVCCFGGSKCVDVKLTDRCGGCDNSCSIDLSPEAFMQLASEGVGRIHDCSWQQV